MPKQAAAKVSWTTEKPTQMASFAKDTVTDMTGNPNFTTPEVPLDDLDKAADDVISTYPKRDEGGMAKTAFETAVTVLDGMLHKQADYVSFTSKGDVLKIQSAGFIATSTVRNAAVRPDAANASKLTAEGGGRVKSIVPKVTGAADYTHIFFTDVNSVINVQQNQISLSSATGGKFIIATGGLVEEASGLPELTKVYNTVVTHNAAGYGNASPVVSVGVN